MYAAHVVTCAEDVTVSTGSGAAESLIALTAVTPALHFDHVSHWYGPVVAVNNLTFSVHSGITGLLGPNGAGKSTLLSLAAGLQYPGGGEVKVFGVAPTRSVGVYRDVALVPVGEALPSTLTIRAFVEARAKLLGISDARGAATQALEMVELDTISTRRIGGLSKGMAQRTKLAAALVHEPRLVLLDEPFNGLDPRQRLQMMRLLEARADAGTAILLSSHILEEIEGVSSRILVMIAGRLAASGDYRALRRLMTDRPSTVRLRSSDDRALASALATVTSVVGLEITSTGLLVRTTDYMSLARSIAPLSQVAGVSILDVKMVDESLEHVFSYLVNR